MKVAKVHRHEHVNDCGDCCRRDMTIAFVVPHRLDQVLEVPHHRGREVRFI